MIEQKNKISEYDFVIMQVEALILAFFQDVIPNYPEQGDLRQWLQNRWTSKRGLLETC
jgi:hypothetical protein